jgi:hypothetical protein
MDTSTRTRAKRTQRVTQVFFDPTIDLVARTFAVHPVALMTFFAATE